MVSNHDPRVYVLSGRMLWDPFLYCINDSIQGNSETGNKVFVLPSKISINKQTLENTCKTYHDMMPGSKGLLPPTDVHELLRSKLLPQFCKHSESVDLLHKSLLPHVWRVPSSKALSCKRERLFDLGTLASSYAVLA